MSRCKNSNDLELTTFRIGHIFASAKTNGRKFLWMHRNTIPLIACFAPAINFIDFIWSVFGLCAVFSFLILIGQFRGKIRWLCLLLPRTQQESRARAVHCFSFSYLFSWAADFVCTLFTRSKQYGFNRICESMNQYLEENLSVRSSVRFWMFSLRFI